MRMQSEHWVDFYVRGAVAGVEVDEITRVNLRRPVKLYDEAQHGDYSRARAAAVSRVRKDAGLHPSTAKKFFAVDPHDWSDSVEAFTTAGREC